MKDLNLHVLVKTLLYWYIFTFISTEALSYLHILERSYILLGEIFFWAFFLFFHHQEILKIVQRINFRSKSLLLILTLFLLTFIQGFFSVPNTTDSMVYHLPRVMYWVQEKTLQQDVIRNLHDFMAPFAEYILLHLYFIGGGDRLLFFSQWVAYVAMVILSSVIAEKLGASKKIKVLTALFVATLPIAVMQASSTQVDMTVTILVMISTYIALILFDRITIKNAILFGLTLGLGVSTKATFFTFMVIPLGLVLFALIKSHWKDSLKIILGGIVALIMPVRFMYQNFNLFGNVLGPFNKGSSLTNENLNIVTLFSNLIRNTMIHIPIPFFTNQAQKFIEDLHKIMGILINASQTTCCDFKFNVIPILYPQEDIVSNTFHLLLILITIIFIIKKEAIKNRLLVLIYMLSLLSIVVFSLVLKWQPFHSRLQIPFFVVGTISSVLILSKFKESLYILKGTLVLSVSLAILLIFLNVSRPFISYTLFYDKIKSFSFPLSSIPQSFFIKPREQQYFNARYYWYLPYKGIIEILTKQQFKNSDTISFDLPDGFEYPLWVLMKRYHLNFRVVPISEISNETIIISTSKDPYKKEGYIIKCIKTEIDYGYACLSKAI